jgi:hypothetical protein
MHRLPCCFFLSVLTTKIFNIFFTYPMRTTWHTHLILLDWITLDKNYKFLHYANFSVRTSVTSSRLGSNILLSNLFAETTMFLLNVRGPVSNPYKPSSSFSFFLMPFSGVGISFYLWIP